MARQREFAEGAKATWMIIFTDMMTLLLTFFIVLVSMSAVDEQSRVRAVQSVRSVFGIDHRRFNFNELDEAAGRSSGAQSTRPDDRQNEARQLFFSDNQNITVRHSETELILEVAGDMLFEPGGANLSEAGRIALDRLVPVMLNMRYPAVISGHGSPGYSEGVSTSLSAERLADNSWALSMDRSLAVYRYFIGHGVDNKLLFMESFGAHRPVYDNNSADGRRKNRRVDIVLDRRNPGLAHLSRQNNNNGGEAGYIFRDFHFDLGLTPPAGDASGLPGGGAR